MTYAIVAVIVLILDQAMKYWTTANVPLDATGSQCVELFKNVLQITDVHNYGAAFNILQNARWLLVGVTVVFVVVVIVLMSREVIHTSFGKWTALLVLAGALGNGIDRALYGYVVDMFELQFMSFPVFNVADIFITVGGILFCLHVIFHRETAEEAAAKQAVAAAPQEEEYVPDYDEMAPVARRRKKPETPYDRVPKRSGHAQARVKPADASDPFAEWEIGSAGEPAAPRGDYEEPEDDYGYDENEDKEDGGDLFSFEPSAPAARPAAQKPAQKPVQKPVQKAAPAWTKPAPAAEPKPSAPAPQKSGAEEFNLDDILAEFGKDK